ncbi:MAG TPA: hypothetical protein GXZ70_02700 [Clostridiales bacterium]|nr:hypothetical protein [Clostridiales bacterium]
MADQEKKYLHSNQLPDRELDGVAGGGTLVDFYRAVCTYPNCKFISDITSIEFAEDFKRWHEQCNPDHSCKIETVKMDAPFWMR